jgi:arylsulfatase
MTDYNIIMLVVDTLRADHLGCYGYHRATSPHLDEFASESVVSDTHIATAIPTHPSFTTMYTGQYSVTHGIVAHSGTHDIPRNVPWLPSILNQHGWTACAVDNLAQWRLDFNRGYEFYIDPTQRRRLSLNCTNREINRRVLPFIEHHADERFFLLVHYWDPHTPYMPPRAYRNLFYGGNPCDPENHSLDGMEQHPLGRTWRETWFHQLGGNITDADYIEALYDSEIRYCDDGIGKVLRKVDAMGLKEKSIVLVTADHGELMYRHGIFFDHHGLYDGNLRVPFLLRHPDLRPRRLDILSGHADVAPTLLEFCGIETPAAMGGENLGPWLRGEKKSPVRDFVVSQECTWQMKWCIRTAAHKFILARQPDFYGTPMRELYDLRKDPGEYTNIVEEDPGTAAVLEEQLEDWIAEKMAERGLQEDPLITHGLSLGRQ